MPHLQYEECVAIQAYLYIGYSHRTIARILGRSNRTISLEIKKNNINGVYKASIAYLKRQTRRTLINTLLHQRITQELRDYIEEKIQLYRSPEQIAGRRKKDIGESLSKDTIYRYIRTHKPKYIEKYLRRKGKPYKSRGNPAHYLYQRRSIHDRPQEANNCTTIGHREGDTMRGAKRKGGFVTLADRETKLVFAQAVQEKTSIPVIQALQSIYQSFPQELRKTLTLDNGREFTHHHELHALGIETFFADPYNPGQRGLNEHSNGLLRQFYPKGSDLDNVQQKSLDYYIDLINNRPRKSLNRLSPYEYVAKKYGVYFGTRM